MINTSFVDNYSQRDAYLTVRRSPLASAALFIVILLITASTVYGSTHPADPTISPWGNTYTTGKAITISDSTPGAAIYYTTDGSTPTANSTLYTGPITIPSVPITETISAVAILNGVSSYSVISTTFTIIPTTALPVISLPSGTYNIPVSVVITDSTPGATIYYTLDSSAPTTSSLVYTGPLQLSAPTSVRAIAAEPGYTTTGSVHNYYQFNVPTPAISPSSGTYQKLQNVTMSDSLPGAKIYYTVDGSVPPASSTSMVYTRPFSLGQTGTEVVRAVAMESGYTPSAMAESDINLTLPAGVTAITVVGSQGVVPISGSFLGYTNDYPTAGKWYGTAATGVNTILRTLTAPLINNMGGPLVIRVGGFGTDTLGEVSSATVEPMIELAQSLNVDYIMGVNLGSNDLSLAEEEASTFTSSMPSKNLLALEIGNEPDDYNVNGIRPATYAYTDFLAQYEQWSAGVNTSSASPTPIAGPVFSGSVWQPQWQTNMLASAVHAPIITQHYYVQCYNPSSPLPSTFLLQPSSSTHLEYLQSYASAAHQVGSTFVLSELNSVCAGGQPGLSNSFSSALWGIDVMFEAVQTGIDGVNWTTNYSGGPYDLLEFGDTHSANVISYSLVKVNPLFYALLFFSQAAGHSASLLPTSTLTNSNMKIWATLDGSGMTHLVIINKDQVNSGNVELALSGYSSASVVRLADPGGYLATAGVTIGGQTFDNSPDGTLQGSPAQETLTPTNGVWTIPVSTTSAVLVNFQP